MKTGTIHMRLGKNFGTLITSLAREYAWEDGKMEKAILLLTDGLPGISTIEAKKIINGTQKLVTLNDLEVTMKKDNWKAPDLSVMRPFVEGVLTELREEAGFQRDTYELRDWLRSNLVIAYRKAKRLREELQHYRKTNMEKKVAAAEHTLKGISNSTERNLETKTVEELTALSIAQIQSTISDPELQQKLTRTAIGKMRSLAGQTKIQADAEYQHDTGWLDTEGIYYSCEIGEHIGLAELLCENFFSGITNAERHLEKLGWAKCTNSEWWFLEDDLYLTKKQLATIQKWTRIHGTLLSWNHEKLSLEEIVRRQNES